VDSNDSIFINDDIYKSAGKSLIQRAVAEIASFFALIETPHTSSEYKIKPVLRY